MDSLALFFSASGRMSPKPFTLCAVAVYLVSFLSQFLLAAPVMAQAGIVPFLLVQLVAGWSWTALHIKRLRDAGRASGTVPALAAIYALAIVLLLLVMAMTSVPLAAAGEPTSGGIRHMLLLSFLIGAVLSDPNVGLFGVVMLAVLALVVLTVLSATAFTIWAALLPRAPHEGRA
jgi:uncharacterized membrane protein YhaH (DUF805 family)